MYGESRLGKTMWARSLGKHLFFGGLYSYKEAITAPEVDYAVIDDLNGGIKFFHSFKSWLGAQQEFNIKGLYKDPELIKWGKPSIWCSNTDPRLDMDHADVTWMEANCYFVEITTPLFYLSCQYKHDSGLKEMASLIVAVVVNWKKSMM